MNNIILGKSNMTDKKPLVSIDVFDTAVFRDVFKPEDVFRVIENKGYAGFTELRIQAQRKAMLKDSSYNILDIYKELPKCFKIKEEILAEIQGCYANPKILDYYKDNKDKLDIVFISDMYLPSSVLRLLLEHSGYKNPKVFVSCEEGCTKSSGALFLKVESKLGRKISKHIGDNYKADIEGATKAGIQDTEFVGSPIYKENVLTPPLRNPKLRKLLIESELNREASIEDRVGFIFAPLALAFTQHLLDITPEDKTIFFNARDSFLMYVIARWILKTKKKIKYCRFSRKSTRFPYFKPAYGITDKQNEKFLNFMMSARVKSLKDLLDSCGLKGTGVYSDVLEKYNISLDTDICFNPCRSQIIKEFVATLTQDITDKALAERISMHRYIERLQMEDGDVFVDLGHFGSMQSIIQEIFKLSFTGEYVHLFSNYMDGYSNKDIKHSFLPLGFLRCFTGIVEMIFTEPAGTVIGYTKKGTPVVKQFDSKYRKEVTKKILKGVLKGVKVLIQNRITPDKADCVKILERFLEHPTLEEAEFANRKVYDNGSLFAFESIVWYDRDRVKQGKLRECYAKSYWKAAFRVLLESDPECKGLTDRLY